MTLTHNGMQGSIVCTCMGTSSAQDKIGHREASGLCTFGSLYKGGSFPANDCSLS